MELHIEETENGFIVTDDEGDKNVIQRKSEEDEDYQECVKELLEFINERMGIMYDEWKGDNLNIQWNKKGDEV